MVSAAGRVISEWHDCQNRRAMRETSTTAPISPVGCTRCWAAFSPY